MDARLINQVMVWERILEMEKEKQKNLHPKAESYSSIDCEPCGKQNKSIYQRIFSSAKIVTSNLRIFA